MNNNSYKDEERVEKNKNWALEQIENEEIVDYDLDRMQQELVIRSINSNVDEKSNINVKTLEEEFIAANYIADDKDSKRVLKEFRNVITFFIANGTLETVSLGSNVMHVNETQLRRILQFMNQKDKTYKMGTRK